MSWYPAAERMELQPESDAQPAIDPTQFIVHSIAAPWTPRRIFEYWRDSTRLESHFGLGFDGALGQYIGTQTRADANMHANLRPDGTGAVSCESASNLQHTDPWTDAQVEALIELGVWLHREHGLPLRICRTHDDPGYGYHRLFPQWSDGGTACPGDARVQQFRELVFPGIVARAVGTTPAPPVPTPPPVPAPEPAPTVARYQATIAGLTYGYGAHGDHVTQVGQALVAAGHGSNYQSGPGPDWTDADTLNYADYQASLGYSGTDADGVPGETTLRRLLGRLPGERPSVSLAHLVAAARTDPGAAQGHTTYPDDVRVVEQALAADGLLGAYSGDGSYGTRTVTAYSKWQQHLGYRGTQPGGGADGIPGRASLQHLGDAHAFTVTD